jgi:hypothetical protein
MKQKQVLFGLAVAVGGVVSAHHLPAGLSHKQGPEVLTNVNYFKEASQAGIPAYHLSTDEVTHGAVIPLAEGDGFTLTGTGGIAETVVFEAADFADISNATVEEVVQAIAQKSTLAEASEDNGYLVMHGDEAGGSGTSLGLEDGPGAPLAKLSFGAGTLAGSDTLDLEISVPSGGPNLPFQPYVILTSATPGTFLQKGVEVPLGKDASTREFLSLALQGLLPGFAGRLDANSDSRATLDLTWIDAIYGTSQAPYDVRFAVVVFSPDMSQVDYVSNAFTLHVL